MLRVGVWGLPFPSLACDYQLVLYIAIDLPVILLLLSDSSIPFSCMWISTGALHCHRFACRIAVTLRFFLLILTFAGLFGSYFSFRLFVEVCLVLSEAHLVFTGKFVCVDELNHSERSCYSWKTAVHKEYTLLLDLQKAQVSMTSTVLFLFFILLPFLLPLYILHIFILGKLLL